MKKIKKAPKTPKPELPIQRVITDYLSQIQGSGRAFMIKTGISKDMVGIWTRMESYMGIDKMAKIIDTFPAARKVLVDYINSLEQGKMASISETSPENNTLVQKRTDNKELADAHRDLQRKYIQSLERDSEIKEKEILKLRNRLKEAGLPDD